MRNAIRSLMIVVSLSSAVQATSLTPALEQALKESTYVYITSTRKDGSPSKPAEIWFFYKEGAVYVGTKPDSWRAKRIKWGRPQATIAVGKATGPSFQANGAIVSDPAITAQMFTTYAKKYPDGWPRYEKQFRDGFKDGSRVLIKYTPK